MEVGGTELAAKDSRRKPDKPQLRARLPSLRRRRASRAIATRCKCHASANGPWLYKRRWFLRADCDRRSSPRVAPCDSFGSCHRRRHAFAVVIDHLVRGIREQHCARFGCGNKRIAGVAADCSKTKTWLIDLNDHTFKEMAPPAEAKQWD